MISSPAKHPIKPNAEVYSDVMPFSPVLKITEIECKCETNGFITNSLLINPNSTFLFDSFYQIVCVQ